MAPAPFILLDSPLSLIPHSPASTSQSTSASPKSERANDFEALAPTTREQEQRSLFAQLHKREQVAEFELVGRSIEARSVQKRSLSPNSTQKVTIGVIAVYAVVIGILWHAPVVKWVLWPWKMLVIGFHEFSHAATGCCTGASIKSISLDPREGGVTMMAGGINFITLPAGYLGSSLIGALLIFCGFDTSASKVASIVVGVFFLFTLWWARKDWLTILTILFATGLIVAFWFIAHAQALRFYILFLGTMSNLYSIWDIVDDLILRKVNESDASVFAKRYGGSSACWGVIWAIISMAFMACAIVGGIAAFPESFSQQNADSKHFIPTKF
ncbi:hypothetical protein T439DRAFT_320902 [Meredithblackwellia eburnea MCA 4105]